MKELENIKNRLSSQKPLLGYDDYETFSVLLLLIRKDDGLRIVFEKRAENIKQGGEICLPGGKVSKHDISVQETALRETYEEIGLPEEKIEVLGKLSPFIVPMGFLIETFVGYSNENLDNYKINHDEVEILFTIPLKYFIENNPQTYEIVIDIKPYTEKNGKKEILFPTKELNLPQKYHEKWGGIKNKIYLYHTEFGPLWGITAKIIYEFSKMLRSN